MPLAFMQEDFLVLVLITLLSLSSIFLISDEDKQQCDTGYFPEIVGYRRHYGDCRGNDLGSPVQTLSVCRKMCDEDERCKAFTFINTPLFRLLHPNWTTPNTCFPRDNCTENTLLRNLVGIYTYFKGLTETGKKSVHIMVLLFCDVQVRKR